MNQDLREQLLVTLGYLKGLSGKPIGAGVFGGVEKLYVPQEIIKPLETLLFPAPVFNSTATSAEK